MQYLINLNMKWSTTSNKVQVEVYQPNKSINWVTSHDEGKDFLIKEISSSVNLKLAISLMHSSKPAKTVYSPPKGFFRKYKSNLNHKNLTTKKKHSNKISIFSPSKTLPNMTNKALEGPYSF